MPYEYEFNYHPGREEINPADYLNRHPHQDPEKLKYMHMMWLRLYHPVRLWVGFEQLSIDTVVFVVEILI